MLQALLQAKGLVVTKGIFKGVAVLGAVEAGTGLAIQDILLAIVTILCGLLTAIVGIFLTHYLGHISKQDVSHVTVNECIIKHEGLNKLLDEKNKSLLQEIEILIGNDRKPK